MNRYFQLAAIFLLSAAALCQETGTEAKPQTTLHVNSRLVFVDVLVRDSHGNVVHGLTQQDFKLTEDGQPQAINFFTAHTQEPAATQAASEPEPAAPQNEFSNIHPNGGSKSITIVLCDLLNTPNDDQLNARQQMLKFLHSLPKGERIALFTLGNGLLAVQGEAGNPALLDAASKMLKPVQILDNSRTGDASDNMIAANAAAQFGRHPGPGTAMEESGSASSGQSYDVRAQSTISALGQVANTMAGYPGRKSMYWLAESFPLSVDVTAAPEYTSLVGNGTQFNAELATTQGHFSQTSKQEMRTTLNLLASARIAVYPTSVFGLVTQSATAAIGGPAGVGTSMPGDPRGGFYTLNNLKTEMNDLARETGGEAIVGTNDVAGAMQKTLEDGATYYSIAYRPANANWNGNFREIKVEATGGASLTYRRGYFALANGPASDTDSDLETVLQPGVPEVAALRLHAKVLPPDPLQPGLAVQSTVETADVNFTTSADGHYHAKLKVQLIAFNDAEQQPKSLPQTSGTLNIDLDPDRYKFIRTAGIAFRQELALKPGKYHVLLGVSDLTSQKLGTVDMELVVPAS
ncbi:MAG: VWA domain-containing protein [Terracidiphilus sp.]|jgi:VWFA-related protein